GQRLEAGQRARADVLQARAGVGVGFVDALGQHPRLGRIKRLVDDIGLCHDAADRAAVFALFEVGADLGRFGGQGFLQGRGVADVGQPAVEEFGDEVGGAAGDVDVLADQVTVDALDEVVRIEVEVFDVRIQLGGDVVAQPFRIHADFEVAQRRD